MAIAIAATASAPGTAQGRANRISSTQTSDHGRVLRRVDEASTGARQTGRRTPASIALASAAGIASTQRPSVRHRPATTISTPVTAKAPSAAG